MDLRGPTGGEGEVDVGPVIDQLLEAEAGTGALIDRLGSLGEGLGMIAPNASPIFSKSSSS